MSPHVSLRVILGRLLNSLHASDFGEQHFEQSEFVEEFESSPCAAVGQDTHEFIPHPFRGNGLRHRGKLTDRGGSGGLDFESKPGREADGSQHPKMVFFEPVQGVADGSDYGVRSIRLAAEVIEDLPCRRVEEQRVDSEVAAAGIANWVRFVTHLFGSTSVAIGVVAAKGRNFNTMNEDNAEMRSNLLGLRIDVKNLGRKGVRGYVKVLWVQSQDEVSDTATNEIRAVPFGAQLKKDVFGCLPVVHPFIVDHAYGSAKHPS
jgi:hypothetical protein